MLKSPVQLKRTPSKNSAKHFSWSKKSTLTKSTLLVIALCGLGWVGWRTASPSRSPVQKADPSSLIGLRNLAPTNRASQLKFLTSSLEQTHLAPPQLQDYYRARYLLAVDLIKQGKGKEALGYLRGLKKDYFLLRPQILWQTARAYQLNNQPQAARRTLKNLIQSYPQSPLSVNALLQLQENSPKFEAKLFKQFPYHPLTQKLVREKLAKQPDQFSLLLLLAKYSRAEDLNPVRDRLVLDYPAQLSSQDWEAIADGYWRSKEHRKAADAYTLAPPIPRNLYRAARGFHRNGNLASASRAYQRLLREYHDAREAGLALIHLARISTGDEAVVYLEKAIAKFPQFAPQAYRAKATVHERFSKHEKAADSRHKLLTKHHDSEAAAAYRWQMAQKLAASGNKREAWQWMQPVVKSQQEFDFVPKALYWSGKWAQELNQTKAAEKTFRKIVKQYPQSYWAWRAAIKLGWQVGNFSQLRSQSPSLELKQTYAPIPTNSPVSQELYLLGQYEDAWLQFLSEIKNPQQLSVNEQFSWGVLQLALGHYSTGMQTIWQLKERETPQEIQHWKTLRQTPAYWQGLFPFPYEKEILAYAQQEKINPLLVISVMRKESTFNPTIDSSVGAVGLMQIVPPTAQWVAKQLKLPEYSLTNPEDNIKIGTWYLNHNHHRYQDDSLLAVASYNAGTGNVNSWLKRFDIQQSDLFVEQIPFPETKDYVEGVFGNYWNYLRLYNPKIRQKIAALQQKN